DFGGTFRGCTFEGNVAEDDAGGVLCYLGGLVEGCVIRENTSRDDGGGAQCGDRDVEGGWLERCRIVGNISEDKGGGVYMWTGGGLSNCVIFANTADDDGGGVYSRMGGPLESCTVASNVAVSAGGGMYARDVGTARNTIIYHNRAPSGDNYRGVIVDGCTYCCTDPGLAGQGNISTDPLFVDLDSGDLRLNGGSGCIDSGAADGAPPSDSDGIPRPLDGDADGDAQVDIGAHEFVHADADTDLDRMPDAWELGYGLSPVSAEGDDGAEGDPDGDRAPNLDEYEADTHPGDADSVLRITGIVLNGARVEIGWQGGIEAGQYVEKRHGDPGGGGPWKTVFTNPPPTALTTNAFHGVSTNRATFYRIRAGRP
ncbi:choice-of-anchor Q domain-containing protein, partial [Verrucomicrobiota bacterium]